MSDMIPKQVFIVVVFIIDQIFNLLASKAKWLSVRLQIKWLWARIPLLSLKLQIWRLLWVRSFLTFRQTTECVFTLKLLRDTIITYNAVKTNEPHRFRLTQADILNLKDPNQNIALANLSVHCTLKKI